MKSQSGPKDVSNELANLGFPSKQNRTLPRLPNNTTIHKRPINHAPVASPYAGPQVPKIVYISRKTPVMSAVKRVKKFLREIEKKALQSKGVNGVLDRRNGQQELYRKLDQVSETLRTDAEEVLVKASGRAMEQALRIADWFKNREQEMTCDVVIRTGSTSVIDDIVEKDIDVENVNPNDAEIYDNTKTETTIQAGEATLELFRHLDGELDRDSHEGNEKYSKPHTGGLEPARPHDATESKVKRRRKRKRKEHDAEDIPEARIRWVKTIEVAISLRT